MEDALQRLAALAGTLKESELRVLLELAARSGGQAVSASSRELARSTALSRSNVQNAIDAMADRGLITSDGGTATRASSYRLCFLDTAAISGVEVLPGRGLTAGPPPRRDEGVGGLVTGPQVALFQGQGGLVTEPPGGLTAGPHPRARVENSDSIELLDRLLRTSPKKHDDALREKAREWLYGYMRKFGRERDPHPPDEQIVAQFLSIAPWPELENLLMRLFRENCEAGKTYAWFVFVALQRLHGISGAQVRQRKAELQLVGRKNSQTNPQAAPELRGEIAAIAARKAMR